MPHYNIWIRTTDDNKWKAIDNRSEWLHKKLSENDKRIVKIEGQLGTYEPVKKRIAEIKPDWKPCKHGSDPKMCKYAKFINGKKICK